jgi:succinate dehydrogenase/fumarate reductase-like Fe-S protein
VAPDDVEELPTFPPAILCSHCYVAFPHFKVKKADQNEEALRHAARLSSDRDLVE